MASKVVGIPILGISKLLTWESWEKCRNPNLGLATKVGVYKGAGQEGSLGVTSHVPENAKECEGMNPHTPKELPLWELESWWTPESSESNCKGQNPLD
jgi:hypothetical protein